MHVNFRGPLIGPDGGPLQAMATSVEGDVVPVELRVGRGGVVYALELLPMTEVEREELPHPDTLRPVVPEARTTRFDLDDFGPPAE